MAKPVGSCLEWQGARTNGGYGCLRAGGKTVLLHRLVMESAHGSIPDGMQVDHLCRNRACYRLSHLEFVTSSENTRRGEAGYHNKLKLARTHCIRGHEYSPENTYLSGSRGRECRKCRAINHREYRERKANG